MFGRRTIQAALLGLAFFTGLAVPGDARAQGMFRFTRPAPAVPQDSAGAPAKAVPVSEIPLRADEALARLQTLKTQLGVDSKLLLIEAALPGELAEVSRAHERLARVDLEQLSLRELWNLTSVWGAYESRLAGWAQDLDEELQEVAWASDVKDGIRDTWSLTARSLQEAEAPPPTVAERVESVLDRAREVDATIRDRLNHLTALKSQLDDGLEGVEQVIRELEAAHRSVRKRVLSRTAPPLWAVHSLREQSTSERAARMWKEDRSAAWAFFGDHSGPLLLSGLFFVLLAFLAARLRERIQRDEVDLTDASVRGAAHSLRRPFSASFLVTILATYLLWHGAPLIFWQLLAAIAVLSLYRLLPPSENQVINWAIRALLLLFAGMVIVDVLVPPSLEYRLLNLVMAVLLTAVTGWLLSRADRAMMDTTPWGKVWYRGLQVSALAGAASVVANITGWSLLAEILLVGVLYSAFLGLCVVIAYRVLAGLIRLLPQTKVGQGSLILKQYGDVVTWRAISVLRLAAFVAWLILALSAFEIVQPIGTRLGRVLTSTIHVGALEFSLDRLASFAVLILLTIWVSRFVAFVLDIEILPRFHQLKRGVANAISTVAHWTILGAGLLMAASALGLQAGQLAIVFGALGVGIGFGLQNIVSNFISGLILIFEQPVKVGDKIEITSLSLVGEVRRIGIRASVVRTFDGAEVIVPNGNLISSEVVNWTLSDQRRRVRVEVGVAYGTDPRRVVEVLEQVAEAHREVLRYPEPNVLFIGFGASSLDFRLQFWTANFDDFFRIQSEVTLGVHDALREAGITIPFPQRDLHLKTLPDADGSGGSRSIRIDAGERPARPDSGAGEGAGGGEDEDPVSTS